MEVEIRNHFVVVTLTIQPCLGETIRASQMTVIRRVAVAEIGICRGPRHSSADLIRTLARGVSAVKGVGRRIPRRIRQSIRTADLAKTRFRLAKRCRVGGTRVYG